MPVQAYETLGLSDQSRSAQPRRDSLSSLADSEVSYKDNLDVEPFDEKAKHRGDVRFHDEPTMEDGEEGYAVEPRRVCSCWFSPR
jgi:dipeptidyl aminopeptidase